MYTLPLKDLETSLGVTLHIRGNREITLIKKGFYLYEKVAAILSFVSTTKIKLTQTHLISCELRISAAEMKAFDCLIPLLNKPIKSNHNITSHIHSGTAYDIFNKLDTRLIGFAVVINPVEVNKYHVK